jgi:uncharacterized protein (TIRG00374 family)
MPDVQLPARRAEEDLASGPPRNMVRRSLALLAQLAVIGGLWFLLLRMVDTASLSAALASADLRLLPLTALGLLAATAMRACRLWLLLGRPGPFKTVFCAHNIGMAVNNLLPFRTGEFILALILRRTVDVPTPSALSTIAVDRILDALALLAFYGLAMLLAPGVSAKLSYVGTGVLAAIVVLIAVMLLMQSNEAAVQRLVARALSFLPPGRRERWLKLSMELLAGLGVLRRPAVLSAALACSFAAWSIVIVACYVALVAFWPGATLLASVLATCFAALGVALVAVPAGVGVMHASFFFGVTLAGMDPQKALLFAVAYHAVILLLTTTLGLVSLRPIGFTLKELMARLRQSRDRTPQAAL